MKKIKDILQENRFIRQSKSTLAEEKDMFLERVRSYNEYGGKISSEHNIAEIAHELSEIAEAAEHYLLSENEDWFDQVTIKRNLKELKAYAADFSKIAGELRPLQERLVSLYDDMGHSLGRYFEIADPAETNESIKKSH